MIAMLMTVPIWGPCAVSYSSILQGIVESIGEDNITIIDVRNTDRILKQIDKQKLPIVHIPWKAGYTWAKYEEVVKENCKDFDALITCSNPINGTFRNDNYSMITNYEKHMAAGDLKYVTKFDFVRTIVCKYKIAKFFAESNKKIIHYVIDPQEFNYARYFKCGYSVYFNNKGDLHYAPSYEKILFNKGVYVSKNTDFTFYGTASTKDRAYLVEARPMLKAIRNSDVSIYDRKSEDQLCPQSEYYKKLSHSRYTLIVPSYDVTSFSMIRFFEDVSNYCLPLVLDTCDLTDVKNTFPDIYDFIKENLVVSLDGIQQKIDELDYEALVFKLYQTQTIKNFFNPDFYKNAWDKFLKED